MMYEIKFADTKGVDNTYYPKPASAYIPDWFKNTPSYPLNQSLTEEDVDRYGDLNNKTIKNCMPVFDAMTTGYIIPTYQDVLFYKNKQGHILSSWVQHDPVIEGHHKKQTPFLESNNENGFLKWINPWQIKTPKGISCLFIAPLYADNKYFECLSGVVDTDVYNLNINFPFKMKDKNFLGLLPAGTPMIQIIPFKRHKWKMHIVSDLDFEKQRIKLKSKIRNSYKTQFRQLKIYR